MFNGFQTTISPAIQVWDFSIAPANSLQSPAAQVGLTSDCAPTQIFYVGGYYYPVLVTLPTAATPGKVITFRVELIGLISNTGGGISIYDSTYQFSSTVNLIATLGTPGDITLVCVANPKMGNSSYSSYSWQVLQGTSASGPTGNFSGYRQAIQLGSGNISSNLGSIAIGTSNTSSATSSLAIGTTVTASASNATAINGTNSATGQYSFIAGGYYGTTNGIQCKVVFPGDSLGTFTGQGHLQAGILTLATQTTDATATALRSNASAAGTTNQLVLQNNSAMYVSGSIIANVTAAGNTAAWSFEAVIKRGANAAATSIVQSVINVVAQNTGATTWVVAVTADTTNGALAVTVTGQAATTIRWVANLRSTEVAF